MSIAAVNRRQFCLATAAAVLMPAPTLVARRRQDAGLQIIELRENVWAITGGGGNSLLMTSDAGPVLIDTKVADVAYALADTVRTTLDGQTDDLTIINTHHHYDHVGGNFAFQSSPAHIDIIAHQNLAARVPATIDDRIKPALARMAGRAEGDERTKIMDQLDAMNPRNIAATHAYEKAMTLDRGNATLQLHHAHNGHTDNDTIIYLEEHNVLHMGDLMFHELHPFIDRPAGANTMLWQQFLAKAMDYCDADTIVIPGHGDITDRSAIPMMIEYFDVLRDTVRDAIAAGKTRDDISAMTPDVFASRGFERMMPGCLGSMYDELNDK
ncbi:MAG: MBL fold metallo-hydrolase [Planctomycetota bacterium]